MSACIMLDLFDLFGRRSLCEDVSRYFKLTALSEEHTVIPLVRILLSAMTFGS